MAGPGIYLYWLLDDQHCHTALYRLTTPSRSVPVIAVIATVVSIDHSIQSASHWRCTNKLGAQVFIVKG